MTSVVCKTQQVLTGMAIFVLCEELKAARKTLRKLKRTKIGEQKEKKKEKKKGGGGNRVLQDSLTFWGNSDTNLAQTTAWKNNNQRMNSSNCKVARLEFSSCCQEIS